MNDCNCERFVNRPIPSVFDSNMTPTLQLLWLHAKVTEQETQIKDLQDRVTALENKNNA